MKEVRANRIVVALGGNALGTNDQEQIEKVNAVAPAIASLMTDKTEMLIVHGNGPQVGLIEMASMIAHANNEDMPAIELYDSCAMSQGYIGYYLQQGISNGFKKAGIEAPIASVVTEIIVDKDDPAFDDPSKPIGLFLSPEQVEEQLKLHPTWHYMQDSGRGVRRAVASPVPRKIVQLPEIRTLLDAQHVVIACGGGGIPVIKEGDSLFGVPAIIDKDLASALAAREVGASKLLIFTAVDYVYIGFNTPGQKALKEISVAQAKKYLKEAQFGEGSMQPKIEAAIEFVESAPERTCIIGSLEQAGEVLSGNAGTIIHN